MSSSQRSLPQVPFLIFLPSHSRSSCFTECIAPICNLFWFYFYFYFVCLFVWSVSPLEWEHSGRSVLFHLALIKSPMLTKKSAWHRLSANSLEWAGGETSKRSWSHIVEDAESGSYTKSELAINCLSFVIRQFTWSEGGIHGRKCSVGGHWKHLSNRSCSFGLVSDINEFLNLLLDGGRMKNSLLTLPSLSLSELATLQRLASFFR